MKSSRHFLSFLFLMSFLGKNVNELDTATGRIKNWGNVHKAITLRQGKFSCVDNSMHSRAEFSVADRVQSLCVPTGDLVNMYRASSPENPQEER